MSRHLAALVDRCLLVGMPSTRLSPKFLDWITEGLGGVNIFHPNVDNDDQVRELCTQLRAAGTNLLIGVNSEGGDVTPLYPGGSPHPGALALGALDSPDVTRAVGTHLGNHLVDLGLNLNVAPVADIKMERDNMVLAGRAFGSDPELVSRHVVAYLEGLQSTGVAGSVKHFPGQGGVPYHGDLELPVSRGDLQQHLEPFRAAFAAGVATVQTAHVVYPELDTNPATWSRPILTDLLRGELGFRGAVISDSLSVAPIVARLGMAEAAIRSLAAGADLLWMNAGLPEQRAVRDQAVGAVIEGRLSEQRLVEAAERVTALAHRCAAPSGAPLPPLDWRGDLGRGLLYVDAPVPLPGPPYVVEMVGRRRGSEPTAASLLAALQQRDDAVTGVRLGSDISALALAVAAARGRPLVLVAADAHRDRRLAANLVAILEFRPDAVLVGLGSTDDAFLAPGRYLGTRGSARPNLEAAARCLLG
jgi:beta-N-acetylhexosaminidase